MHVQKFETERIQMFIYGHPQFHAQMKYLHRISCARRHAKNLWCITYVYYVLLRFVCAQTTKHIIKLFTLHNLQLN